METTIEYNPADEMFTVNTPHPMAQKYWITNGAIDAHYCLVFGDLRIRGHEDTFGVHGVILKIRDLETHEPMPGVTVQDMAHKMGLNGIDNAKLAFNNVKVPRDALLDRFAQIDADGTYHTEVEGPVRARFLKTADQLLSGRLCIASMSQGVSKGLLAIAVEYSCSRLSTGPVGESTAPIMAFALQQQALMPLLAKTIACEIALFKAKTAWAMNRQGKPIVSNNMLIAYCCAIKAYTGWHVNKTVNIARERCGGQGFLSANRFGSAITGTHSSITAEGDCSVLMMKVIMELGNEMKTNKKMQKDVQRDTMMDIFMSSPLVRLLGTRALGNSLAGKALLKDGGADPKFIKTVLDRRANITVGKSGLAMTQLTPEQKKFIAPTGKAEDDLDAKTRKRKVMYHKVTTDNQHLIQKAAYAWTEAFIADSFLEAIEEEEDPQLKAVLHQLFELYCLDCIKSDLGTFKEKVCNPDVEELEERYAKLCRDLAPNALGLCDSFGFTPEMASAPIAGDWIKYNAIDNQGEVKGIDY